MRQAVMTEPGVIQIREVPEPVAGPNEVLLRVHRIGICGSDMHVYHGVQPFTKYPVVQGHEFSAVIEALGEGVTDLKPGTKATARPQVVCGRCRPCLRGDYNICDSLKVQGFQAPGCVHFRARSDRRADGRRGPCRAEGRKPSRYERRGAWRRSYRQSCRSSREGRRRSRADYRPE
jgi:threonine dehydrogenase-like Zn-dependent dehydrogenase